MESLVSSLFDVDAIKFGNFKLKSGLMSPIYLDLRVIIGYPVLMNSISEAMYSIMTKEVDQLCGVPYTAFPLASCISINHNIPSVIKRKEVKGYGTNKLIEGVFSKGMSCCIIEDVITTGSSVIETAKELQKVGLQIKEAIVLVDRGQGGRRNIENLGIALKSLLTLPEILTLLLTLEKITAPQYDVCKAFIEGTQVALPIPKKMRDIDWKVRSAQSENKVARRLFEIMSSKKTSLCVAADVRHMKELSLLASEVAPHICMLKVHADIIHDFDVEEMRKIKQLSLEQHFLIMEDRKFADIGNTVKMQLENRAFDYLSWSDLVTVHCLPGDGVLSGIEAAARERNVDIGCVLIAEMSSSGSLADDQYKESCAAMALRHRNIVVGFVSQSLVTDACPGLVHCTPGVKLAPGADSLGQNYRSLFELKKEGFTDVFIVGRGITEADSPAKESELYQAATVSDLS